VKKTTGEKSYYFESEGPQPIRKWRRLAAFSLLLIALQHGAANGIV